MYLFKMAAKDVVGSEKADLKQRFESSFPLDDLLPALLTENVFTVDEMAHLLPTRQYTCLIGYWNVMRGARNANLSCGA